MSHVVNLPSGIQSGHLLVVPFVIRNGLNMLTWPGGWSDLFEVSGPSDLLKLSVRSRVADGTEGATITVTSSGDNASAHQSYRIIDHDSGTLPVVSAGAQGTSTTPDPDSLTPAGGAKDYLWIAIEGHRDGDGEATGFPASYGLSQSAIASGTTGGDVGAAIAGRQLNAASENPGTFTIAVSFEWIAVTLAVYPVAAPAAPTEFTGLVVGSPRSFVGFAYVGANDEDDLVLRRIRMVRESEAAKQRKGTVYVT